MMNETTQTIVYQLQPLCDDLHVKMKREKDLQGKTNRGIADRTGVPLSTTAKFFSGSISSPGVLPVAAFSIDLGLSLDEMLGIAPTTGSEKLGQLETQLERANSELDLLRHHNEVLESGLSDRKPVIFGLTTVCLLLAVALIGYLTMDISNLNFGFFTHEGVSVVGIAVVALLLASIGVGVSRFIQAIKKKNLSKDRQRGNHN